MNLRQLNTFFLTFWPVCCNHTANRPKSEEKSVQLAEVHLYRIYFLQNPYLSVLGIYNFEGGLLPKRECHHHLHKNYLVTTENS